MNKLGIGTQKLLEFRIFIGSGEFLLCHEDFFQVALVVQGITITQDLFVLPMEGANMVLSIQWLKTLGMIKTNHKEQNLEFDQGE